MTHHLEEEASNGARYHHRHRSGEAEFSAARRPGGRGGWTNEETQQIKWGAEKACILGGVHTRTWLTRPSTGSTWTTGAIVSVTVQDASDGDTATLIMAAEQVELLQPDGRGVEEAVADKGITLTRRWWHSARYGSELRIGAGTRPVLPAGQRRRERRRRRSVPRRRRCMRTAGVWAGGGVVDCNAAVARWWSVLSRTCMRREECAGVWVRGHENVRKRVLIQAAACNIGLLLRHQTGIGTPWCLQGRALFGDLPPDRPLGGV